MLKVVPVSFPKKYYKWLTAKPKKKKRFSAQDTTTIPCHAILYKLNGQQDTVEIWNKKLINKVSPVFALVSNDGKRVVTLDNWHSMGYGNEVLVVYDEVGELVRKYQLEDFSVFTLNDYYITVSSIWWRCGVELINKEYKIKLCMQTEDERTSSVLYNLNTYSFEKAP